MPESEDSSICKKTKSALLWMSLANEPFVALYALIPFILRKELCASLVQLSLLASLRPLLPIFSFYWSAGLSQRTYRLRNNLIGSWCLARLPFLLVPWLANSWYLIFCCASYELFKKSGNPALIEILKINIQKGQREHIYTICFMLSFLESILFGVLITKLLGNSSIAWNVLIGITAMVSLSSLFVQMNIPIPTQTPNCIDHQSLSPNNLKNWLLGLAKVNFSSCLGILQKVTVPWKDSIFLLRNNLEFFRFQCGFMIGGIGLMLVAPALSVLYVDQLGMSSSEIAVGRSVLMGIGVVCSAPIWERIIAKQNTGKILRNVLFGFFLYLFVSYLSIFNSSFFYLSNFIYGLAQSGSHLLWNLSGPIFSGNKDSTKFSSTNILMVALRGAVVPALGGIMCSFFGPAPTFLMGGGICLLGVFYMIMAKDKNKAIVEI